MGIAKLQHFFFYSFSVLFPAIALRLMPLFADGLRRIATILAPLDCYRSRGRMQAAIRLGRKKRRNSGMRQRMWLEFLSEWWSLISFTRSGIIHIIMMYQSPYGLFPLPKYWLI
ncbi:hypothetical protein CW755_14265 [Geobacillus thermodenitrificans]|jgi:hypothetical protein|nr:hypothetical protein CW755_14265 [Geobacillus thermodenitrificans]